MLTFLAEGFTWFNLIPGFDAANASFAEAVPPSILDKDPATILHISLSLLATAVVVLFAMVTTSAWSRDDNPAIPDEKFGIRNFVEVILDTCLSLGEQILGSRKEARRFLPLVGTLALYIFFCNILGLIPGFAPPTDNLNITFAPAIVVFLVTHYVGLKAQGSHYLAHFLGPKLGGIYWLAPLMIIIEVVAHIARPVSLGLRLMGNMTGDHKVLAVFLGLVPFVVPIPALLLGTLVCTVQTLVFCLLTLVYIALSIEHSEEAH